MTADQRSLWSRDPSPSWNAIAATIGVDPPLTSPEEPVGDIEWQVQAFWPDVPAYAREQR